MAIILSVLAILSVVFLISYGGKQTSTATVPGRYITLTASGVAYGSPTQGLVYLFVNATANNSSTALQNMESIVSALNSSIMPYLNGNVSEIKTESYSVFKVYNSTNWEASEVISVTLPNISNTNRVIGVLGGIGGVGVQSSTGTTLTFTVPKSIKAGVAECRAERNDTSSGNCRNATTTNPKHNHRRVSNILPAWYLEWICDFRWWRVQLWLLFWHYRCY